MRKLLFLLIFISSYSFGQETTFDDLIRLYKQGSEREIPPSAIHKFFNINPEHLPGKLRTGIIAYNSEDNLAITTRLECMAGGTCRSTDMYLFTMDGTLLDKYDFSYSFSECVSEKSRSYQFLSDTVMIFRTKEYLEDSCDDDPIVITNYVAVDFVTIGIKSFEITTYEIDTRRKYHDASSKWFHKADLMKYKKDELATIRNEVFAAHGYKFKSSKWRDFFGDKSWYNPRYDDVLSKLTVLEKNNVELIVQLEKE